MFKKFSKEEDFAGFTQVKSSVGRAVRSKVLEQMPGLTGCIDDIMPKKSPVIIAKCHNYISVVTVNNQILFFNDKDGPYYPTLQLLHKYPNILPHVQVDRGAIKFVMQGANIMCPGLTSPGGRLPDDEKSLPAETVVAIMAEGKENALGLGLTKLSTKEIKSVNKGIAIENIHYLNDGLWKLEL
eukprot:TRINITY_DN2199_c0_g1_i1.p2 TRINITY_DN2199_c0_g1~~TRINITY_DN2199_c0_g1_i1.p2  ORF type:complete len:184 (-),score=39.62 TRINITY_DN2199_c0_g1_i1:757-1308(-)